MLTLYIWSKIRRIKKKILKTYWKLCPGPKIRNVTNMTTPFSAELECHHSPAKLQVCVCGLAMDSLFYWYPLANFMLPMAANARADGHATYADFSVLFSFQEGSLDYGLEKYPQRLSSWKRDWHSLVLLGEWRRHAVRTGPWDHSYLFWWAGFSWGKAFLPPAFRAAGSKARESTRNEDKPSLPFSMTHIPQVFCSTNGHWHALLY